MENEKYYEILAQKLDATVQGLSKIGTQGNVSETWMEYLRVLVPPEDVKYLVELHVFPNTMSVKKFARKINKSEDEAIEILERLFQNDCVARIGSKVRKYGIQLPLLIFDAPPLSYEKYPKEKAKKLAELSYKYLVEEEWYRNFEGSETTPLSRILPVQKSIKLEQNILSHEDIEEIIEDAEILGLQKCACRTRMEYLGKRKCQHPLESCISVGWGARLFIDRGIAREISKEEAKKLLRELNKMGLVHTTDNFREGGHLLLCSCCSDCCSLIGGITRWDNPRAVAASNFLATIKHPESCTQCEKCIDLCNFKAISMGEASPVIDEEKCMGCGVCIVNCPDQIIELKRLEREHIYKDLLELAFKVAKETNREIRF